jgi:xanthine dehydrogenase accessory factor
MSTDLYRRAAEFSARGRPFAIATVVRVEGSSSAPRGSKGLIDEHGKLVVGWVGGGCAESAVKTEALKCMAAAKPQMITLDLRDDQLGVGMPCGGKMEVFIEPVLPRPELLIVGHGGIAETLCTLGHLMGFTVTVNDPAADPANFPQAARLVTEDFDLTETPIGTNTYTVIATQHKRDHLWLEKALEGNAAYVALVASRHRSKLVLDYVAAAGVAATKIATVFAPAGIDLGAATPAEIALSIMSQIVALRRRGTTRTLSLESNAGAGDDSAAETIIRQCEVQGTS